MKKKFSFYSELMKKEEINSAAYSHNIYSNNLYSIKYTIYWLNHSILLRSFLYYPIFLFSARKFRTELPVCSTEKTLLGLMLGCSYCITYAHWQWRLQSLLRLQSLSNVVRNLFTVVLACFWNIIFIISRVLVSAPG